MPALTLKSCAAALLGLVMMAMLVQFIGVLDAPSGGPFGTEALPLSALDSFLALVGLGALVQVAFRRRLFTAQERLFILYVMLMAAPLMSTGFWRFMLSSVSTVVRLGDWEKYDALSPMLWPHGANIAEGRWAEGAAGLGTAGHVSWQEVEFRSGQIRRLPVLENTRDDGLSILRMRIPVEEAGTVVLPLQQPYLVAMLVRATDLQGSARYFLRAYPDEDAAAAVEWISARTPARPSHLHPGGFVRLGNYGLALPGPPQRHLTLEIGLQGIGQLELADLDLFDVSALQATYTGWRRVSRAEYEALPAAMRPGLVVMPENWFSWEALRFAVTGYIPWGAWLRGPLAWWGGYIALMLIATFAFSLIMRKQWIQNERFPLPMAHVSISLAGADAELRENGENFWKNPALWVGFIVMFFWALNKASRDYGYELPNLTFNINIKSYLSDPMWGRTWDNVDFSFSGLFFAIGLFMELNVLLSLVLGFLLYRLQYWLGESQGLSVDKEYPYGHSQLTGSFLAYGLLLLWLARKHLARVWRLAWTGQADPDEPVAPRTSFLLLVGAFLGMALLSSWAGFSIPVMLGFSVCFLLALLVAMKFRAECGMPTGGLFFKAGGVPILAFILLLGGGVAVYDPATAIVITLVSCMFFNQSVLGLVPGLQMEWTALGHRVGIRFSQLMAAVALAILGGILIGGWFYLSNAYAVGANNFPIPGHFNGFRTYMKPVNDLLAQANETVLRGEAATAPVPLWRQPEVLAMAFGALGTFVLTLLRQWFAGFWFHPLGFLAGPTQMMQDAWGSLLLAWLVRFLVLKLGGASAVRHKLFPFAVGCLVAIVTVSALFVLVQIGYYFFLPGGRKFDGRF
jgi:hypothetical protein